MHSQFAWGFWWLNVIVCICCIFYLAPKRFPDRTPALLTTGPIFICQLLAALVVLALDASPWHLIWLAFVSIVVSNPFSVIGLHLYRMRLDRQAKIGREMPERAQGKKIIANERRSAGQISELEALRQESRKRGKTEVSCKAGALLDSDAKRNILYDSLGEHPALAAKLHHHWPYLVRSNAKPTPLKVSLMFSNMAVKLAEEGEPFAGLKSIECSLLFDEGGPNHWVAHAEVLCALHDRAAARYATAVIEYQDACDTATKDSSQFSFRGSHRVSRGEYKRMLEIIQICCEHKEWVDTYSFAISAIEKQ